MKNEKIINAWNKIEPGDETKQKIFENIMRKRQEKNKLPKFKKIMIIAAVATVVFMLMGAGVAGVIYYYEMTYYDMNGNIRIIEEEVHPISSYESGSEEYEFEEQLAANKENNAILFMLYKEENTNAHTKVRIYSLLKEIKDYEELKDYLKKNGGELLKLPEYIPDGYRFDFAQVNIEFSGDIDYEKIEPAYREEKFGNIYEKYILSGEQKQIRNIYVYYIDGKKQIIYESSFSGLENIDDMSFGTQAVINPEPELIDIPQFERSLLMSFKSGFSQWSLKAVKSLDEPVDIFNNLFISKTWRENQNETYLKNFKIYKNNHVVYTIYGLSRGEIIKMAESIK